MGQPKAPPIEMSPRHQELLMQLSRNHSTAQQIAKRARILIQASQGVSNSQIRRDLSIAYNTVKNWRKRWESVYASLLVYEKGVDGQGVTDKELTERLIAILQDEARSGAPTVISLAQLEQLVALACEKPSDYGIERTDWTYDLLAETAISQGIVESISGAWLGTLIKKNAAPTS